MSHNHHHADDVALSHVVEPALPLIFEFIYSKETGRAGSSDPKRSEGLEVENLGQLRHTATKLSKYVTHFEEDWFWTMNGKNSLQLIHDLNSRSIRHWQHRVTFTIVSFLCLVFFRMLCGRLQKFRCGAAAPCWQLDANASN